MLLFQGQLFCLLQLLLPLASLGTSIKEVRFFASMHYIIYIPSSYVYFLYPIFLDMPTYPKKRKYYKKSVPNLSSFVLMITGLSIFHRHYQDKISRACRIRCISVENESRTDGQNQMSYDRDGGNGWRGAGGPYAHQEFGSSCNPIST